MKWEEEYKGKKHGGCNEATRGCLVKGKQNCQVGSGLGGHQLAFLRQIGSPTWYIIPCTRNKWGYQLKLGFAPSIAWVAWNKWAIIMTPTQKMNFPRQALRKQYQTSNETQGKPRA